MNNNLQCEITMLNFVQLEQLRSIFSLDTILLVKSFLILAKTNIGIDLLTRYNIKVLIKKSSNLQEISYSSVYKKLKTIYETMNINYSTKTQMGRKTGSAMAEIGGASEDSINKQGSNCINIGNWATASRNGAYSNDQVAWESCRALAGASPDRKAYFLKRDVLDPPEELQKLIFPGLDEALNFPQAKKDLATRSFLNFLKTSRKIILQDAALLLKIDKFKQFEPFAHQIFKSDEFLLFQQNLLTAIEERGNPQMDKIKDIVPEIEQQLIGLNSMVNSIPVRIEMTVKSSMNTFKETFLEETKDLFLKESQRIRISAHQDMVNAYRNFGDSMNSRIQHDTVPILRPIPDPTSIQNLQSIQTNIPTPTQTIPINITADNNNPIHAPQMNNTLNTIRDIWIEIRDIILPNDIKYGIKWRTINQNVAKFYGRSRRDFVALFKILFEEKNFNIDYTIDVISRAFKTYKYKPRKFSTDMKTWLDDIKLLGDIQSLDTFLQGREELNK